MVFCGPRPGSTDAGVTSPASRSRPIARYTTGRGIRQIRPSSPPGSVSCEMAKPCAGCWQSSTRTVHSASDSGASMSLRVAGPTQFGYLPALRYGRTVSVARETEAAAMDAQSAPATPRMAPAAPSVAAWPLDAASDFLRVAGLVFDEVTG